MKEDKTKMILQIRTIKKWSVESHCLTKGSCVFKEKAAGRPPLQGAWLFPGVLPQKLLGHH